MNTLWESLSKPIFSLAPMEDVTDTVFRQIVMLCGRPDVFFTEFTNVDGLMSVGEEIVAQRLKFERGEKPLVAQIWGVKPENFYKASQKLAEMGFDAIDINMGCPQRDVTRHGACSALIKNHILAQEIIDATRSGAGNLPVSVKTRIGFSKIQTEEWIGFLLEQNLPLITVHGRTAAEMSAAPAHWDEIVKAVYLKNAMGKRTLMFGNGDVESLSDAKEKIALYGVDGVMIGRGIFHNPWLFAGIDITTKTLKDRLELLQKHVSLYRETWGDTKNYQILKKYFKIYLSGFDGASDLRVQFMETKSYEEVLQLVDELTKTV